MKNTHLLAEALTLLDKYGIEYEVHEGELFVSDAIGLLSSATKENCRK